MDIHPAHAANNIPATNAVTLHVLVSISVAAVGIHLAPANNRDLLAPVDSSNLALAVITLQ